MCGACEVGKGKGVQGWDGLVLYGVLAGSRLRVIGLLYCFLVLGRGCCDGGRGRERRWRHEFSQGHCVRVDVTGAWHFSYPLGDLYDMGMILGWVLDWKRFSCLETNKLPILHRALFSVFLLLFYSTFFDLIGLGLFLRLVLGNVRLMIL